MGNMRIAAAAAALALVSAAAQALPAVQAEFRLGYYPPNPCNDIGQATLNGLASLYLDGSTLASGGPPAALGCSDDGTVSAFELRFDAPSVGTLAFAFAGHWALPDGEAAVCAFECPNPGPPDAPQLLLGTFDRGVFTPAGPGEWQQWQLVGYPGSDGPRSGLALGEIEVRVSAVPEPATLAMLLAGLALVAGATCRTRQGPEARR